MGRDIGPIFESFALAFAGRVRGEGEIAAPHLLDRGRLDASLESLAVVDEYLGMVHEALESFDRGELDLTVLRGGAYVGEVIRRNAAKVWHWEDYDDYVPRHPKLREMIPERDVHVCAFLVDADDGMIMPLNKVRRFLVEGPEHATAYFARSLG